MLISEFSTKSIHIHILAALQKLIKTHFFLATLRAYENITVSLQNQ